MSKTNNIRWFFVIGLIIFVMAGGATFAEDDTKKAKDESWKKEIIERMKKKAEFNYEEAELPDVIRDLSELTNFNIILHPEARLMEDGSPRLVTIYAPSMSCMSLLDWVVYLQGDLSWEFRDEAIIIDLHCGMFDDRFMDKIYDITELTNEHNDRAAAFIGRSDNYYYLFGTISVEERILRLQEIIRGQEPDSWADPRASISYFNGDLYISQWGAVHKKIDRVLSYLKQAENMQISFDGSMIELPRKSWNAIINTKEHKAGMLSPEEEVKLKGLLKSRRAHYIRTFNISGANAQRNYIAESTQKYNGDEVFYSEEANPGFAFEIMPVLDSDRKNIYAEIACFECKTNVRDKKNFKSESSLATIFETSLQVPVGCSFYFVYDSSMVTDANVRVFYAKGSISNPVASIENLSMDHGALSSKPDWQKDIEQKLEKKIDIRFEDISLSEVLRQISKESGINIIIRPGTVTDEESLPKTISLNLKNATIKQIIRLIFVFQGDLSWEYRNEAIFVDFKKNIDGRYVEYAYDIRDLLFLVKNKYFSLSSKKLLLLPPETAHCCDEEQIFQPLLDIFRMQDPDSWEKQEALIMHYNGILFINQKRSVHEMIKKCLASLREKQSKPISYTGTIYELEPEILEKVLADKANFENGLALDAAKTDKLAQIDKTRIKRNLTFTQLSGQRSYFADVEYKTIPVNIEVYDYSDDDDTLLKPNEFKIKRSVESLPAGFLFDIRGIYSPVGNTGKGNVQISLIVRHSKHDISNDGKDKISEQISNCFVTIPEGGTVGMKIGMSGNGKGKNGRKVLFLVLRADVNGK